MADAYAAGYCRAVVGLILQHLQAALRLGDLQTLAAMHAHTGRVIASVFQLGQAVQ